MIPTPRPLVGPTLLKRGNEFGLYWAGSTAVLSVILCSIGRSILLVFVFRSGRCVQIISAIIRRPSPGIYLFPAALGKWFMVPKALIPILKESCWLLKSSRWF